MAHYRPWSGVLLPVVVAATLFLSACGGSHKVSKTQRAEPSRQDVTRTDSSAGPGTSVPTLESYELSDIHFDFDRAHVRPGDREVLMEHGQWLTKNRSARILIEGHCDERGTIEYNLALGERRAEAARDFLETYGVASDRLEVVSYGKERPFASEHDEYAWTLNRRAHFVKR